MTNNRNYRTAPTIFHPWRLPRIFFAIFVFVVFSEAHAAWPQFRGPDGSATAADQRVPDRFGPGVNVLWKHEVPLGSSSLVVWGDKIFLTGYEGEKLLVLSYDRSNGSLVWLKELQMRGKEEFYHRDSSPAAPTICLDAERIYAYFGAYGSDRPQPRE